MKGAIDSIWEKIPAAMTTIRCSRVIRKLWLRKERVVAEPSSSISRLSKESCQYWIHWQPPHILDPSDPEVIGKLIADTLLVQPRHKLSSVAKFYGSGVYAIYYAGPFYAYELITGTDKPIYVGKADPASADAISPSAQGTTLWRRLQDHRKTISAATSTLDINDFDCRFLVVKSAWQGTAESYLIDRFKPVWNNEVGICYGFGKHGDSATTRGNTRSPWDTLHPGRKWAGEGNKPNPLSASAIAVKIVEHLRSVAGLG